MAKAQLLSTSEVLTPYTRCVEQRRKMLARIKRLKATPNYDHETVRVLLSIARRLSFARDKLLDNYMRSYYAESKIPEAQQAHFRDRERGRAK
jgi:hypothetical protein